MHFKRFLYHLQRQDWLAVAIEFVIVVAGVFLGMQVSNWNEARSEDARAKAYLARLHDDLNSDIRTLNANTVFVGSTLAYAHAALSYAENGELAKGSAWQTVLAFYQAGQLYPDNTADATYREMMYAGDLRLIRDQRLSAALGTYYIAHAQASQQLFSQLPAYRQTIRELMPQRVQSYVWDRCYRQSDITAQTMVDCASPISDSEARAILRDLTSDGQTIRQLRFWATQMRIEKSVLAAEREAATRLSQQVSRQLSN